jgi:8-oxo-dGTP pyrophosphatase MutT (NUDIX family)
MIRRAERDDDPWSGHMALPGGRAHASDPSARAVATRETAEEVGLALTDAHFVAELDDTLLRPDKPSQSVLSAFAFHVGTRRPPLSPQPSEVADAHWVPLEHLWDPARTTTMPWTHRGQALTFPGIAVGDHIVWGLTLRVLFRFGQVVGHPLPLPTDLPKIHRPAKSSAT